MTPREDETTYMIRLVQSRFEWLKLTPEQALAVHRYERDIETVQVEGVLPSYWENKHIEWFHFSQILDSDQLALYKTYFDKQVLDEELALVELDKASLRNVEYASKMLAYYKNTYIPRLLEYRDKHVYGGSYGRERKLNYLKEEYQIYLKRQWKEWCISHFRSSRNFQPNGFRELQLTHEINKVVPTYYFFKKKADEATRAVAKSLIGELGYYMEQYQQRIVKQRESLQVETEAIYKAYFPDHLHAGLNAFVIGGDQTERERLEDEFLSYLLIDPERYE